MKLAAGTNVQSGTTQSSSTMEGAGQQPETASSQSNENPSTPRRGHLDWTGIRKLLVLTFENAGRHKLPRLSASLAFYAILSMTPVLIVVIAIAAVVFGKEAAIGQLVWQIEDLVGHEGATAIQTIIASAHQHRSGTLATSLGLVTLFFGASTVVAELRDSLNTIWEVPPSTAATHWHSVLNMLRGRFVAFASVLGIGLLLLLSLAFNAALAAIGSFLQWELPANEWLLQGTDFAISFVVTALFFGLLYRTMPDAPVTWRDVALGASITSLLFTTGKFGIGLYLGKAGFTSSYGAAGSLVILLVWVYYSAQIFFFGAEFTHAYAELYGSRPVARLQRQTERAAPLGSS